MPKRKPGVLSDGYPLGRAGFVNLCDHIAGISRKEIAEKLGFTPAYIGNVMWGTRLSEEVNKEILKALKHKRRAILNNIDKIRNYVENL